ncbi:hypothetical protein [Methylobacterium oryzisoli]
MPFDIKCAIAMVILGLAIIASIGNTLPPPLENTVNGPVRVIPEIK